MYNALVELIGEQEKKCLPFVNMCLRAWMKRLSEDVDLFANLDILDFEQWALDEIENPTPANGKGKTIYQLMMSVFGQDSKVGSNDGQRQEITREALWSKLE